MSPTEPARNRTLLTELSRINNDYGVLQRQTQRDLARSRHELAEARGILGTVAHDLRTPLQAVIGFAELLLEADLEPDQRDLVERIASSGRTMSELTEDLLRTFAGGSSTADLGPVNLPTLVEELISRYNLLAARSGTPLVLLNTLPREVWIAGDATQLRRAIENLVNNALKFSPPEGTVRVELAAREGSVEITVRDEGPGIDEAEHDRIFEPFHRAPGSDAVPGVGLGLPIVRQVVEQHGGTVSVDSRPGAGATFAIRLPLVQPASPPKADSS